MAKIPSKYLQSSHSADIQVSSNQHTNRYLHGDGICTWWRTLWLHCQAWKSMFVTDTVKLIAFTWFTLAPFAFLYLYWFDSNITIAAEGRRSKTILSADHLWSRLLPSAHDCASWSQARESLAWQAIQCQDCRFRYVSLTSFYVFIFLI